MQGIFSTLRLKNYRFKVCPLPLLYKACSMSLLLLKTQELLRNRSRGKTYKDIETDTGLKVDWLTWFSAFVIDENKSSGPSVIAVEKLYNYLSETPLFDEHEKQLQTHS